LCVVIFSQSWNARFIFRYPFRVLRKSKIRMIENDILASFILNNGTVLLKRQAFLLLRVCRGLRRRPVRRMGARESRGRADAHGGPHLRRLLRPFPSPELRHEGRRRTGPPGGHGGGTPLTRDAKQSSP